MSLVSLYRDFTLRSGDAIMTQKGFQIFRGASQWPYKPRDFANLSASKLAPAERRLLQRIEKVSINPNSSPREQPKTPPRTTATPVPMLGPFKVDRAALIAPAVSPLPGRTAQAPTTAFP